MTRNIKFRGYSKKLDRWIYGYYIKHIDETFNPFGMTQDEKDKWNKEHTKHYIVVDSFSDWNMPRDITLYEVDEHYIGQFAEVYDSNNKEIYEWDIVEYKGQEGLIEYLNGSFIIVLEEEIVYLYEVNIDEKQITVKGNCYENSYITNTTDKDNNEY